MSLLNRLFKPKKQANSTPAPASDLQQADTATLKELATTSSDPKLREQAIAHMAFSSELLHLATGEHSVKVKTLARQQVGICLEKDLSLLDDLLKNQSQNQAELINLVSYSKTAIETVFSRINDEEILRDIALNGATSHIRQHAAAKVTTKEQLEALLNALGKKDKSVAKIARDKLDHFKRAQLEQAERKSKIEQVCSDQENLLKRKIDDYFFHRVAELDREWSQFAAEDKAEFSERFAKSARECQQRIDEYQERDKRAQAEKEKQQEGQKLLAEASAELRELICQIYATPLADETSLQHILSRYDTQVSAIAATFPALQADCARYFALRQSARQLWQDSQSLGSLGDLVGRLGETDDSDEGKTLVQAVKKLLQQTQYVTENLPPEAERAQRAIEQWAVTQRERSDREKALLKKVNDLVRKANWAIDNGRIRQARGIYKELQEKASACHNCRRAWSAAWQTSTSPWKNWAIGTNLRSSRKKSHWLKKWRRW